MTASLNGVNSAFISSLPNLFRPENVVVARQDRSLCSSQVFASPKMLW